MPPVKSLTFFSSSLVTLLYRESSMEKTKADKQCVIDFFHLFGSELAYFFFKTTFIYSTDLFQQYDAVFWQA